MYAFHLTFVIFVTVFSMFMFVIWNNKDWFNFLIKLALFVQFAMGSATLYGYLK